MAHYLLARHAYLCVTADHAVILDLERDAYCALSKGQADSLVDVVAGWPRPIDQSAGNVGVRTADSCAALKMLLDRGLLTTEPRSGKSATPLSIEAPDVALLPTALVHTLMDGPNARRPQIRIADVVTFLAAYVSAVVGLHRGLVHVVESIRARRAKASQAATPPELERCERLRTLVRTFRLVRPFIYAAASRCLFDSLVLVEFLARHNMHASWVFGVTTRPFTAHCWVQDGNAVLNDTPEHASQFTPIMAV